MSAQITKSGDVVRGLRNRNAANTSAVGAVYSIHRESLHREL
jgi:hypothetical protein